MKSMKNIRCLLSLTVVLLLLLTGCAAKSETKEVQTQTPAEDLQLGTVQTDAFSMQYLRFGTGEKPLVILPGLSVQSVMGSAAEVKEAYAPLTQAFTIYLLEPRTDLPSTYTIADMAEDAAAAMRELGLKSVCLFGVSQGGMTAMEIAVHHPDLVQKLVLGSTAAKETKTLSRTLETWVNLAKSGDAKALYLSFGEALYPQAMFEQSRELLIETAKTVTKEELQRFVILAESMKGFDVTGDLKKIRCPVLVLGAKDDQVLGAGSAQQIAEVLQDHTAVELYMYEGYGHAAYDTAPDYKERLLQFLDRA